ncbi:MAG: sugar ABC transporter permease [Ruminococcaceae bacterium]|nr:sugar ABC transporter permease [Oscillospiraceae bacterium]
MMTKRVRRPIGLETKKARYGYIFIAPWIIGVLLFFIYPIVQSAIFSFSKLHFEPTGVETEFVGTENFNFILNIDPNYTGNLSAAISSFFVSLPFILVLSLILALLLNNNFRGRLFFRAMYFIPVIMASGPALVQFLEAAGSNATDVAVADSVSFAMMDFTEVLEGLSLPPAINDYLGSALDGLFMMVWQSGIQIVLFIAGLQSIPDLLYEVAKVEGATKWEEFWFVTLPMLLRPMLLVVIFTMVETIISKTNPVIKQALGQFNNMEAGQGSAMLWFYFLIVGAIIALLLFIYNYAFLRKWG